jgi:hypothetical protein
MTTFYFDTGVNPNGHNLYGQQIVRNGTVQIPFRCEGVPSSATLMFACDNPNLPESKYEWVMVAAIEPGSDMVSKFAYFRLQKENKS